jgi:hypothetical protein
MLPNTIQIGTLVYMVDAVKGLHDDGGDLYGEADYQNCIIRIDDKFTDCQRTSAILWHETIHAILDQVGMNEEVDEKAVIVLGLGIADIIKHNCDLVKLTQETK